MDVSIIIVNYNTYALTKACIQSVIKYTEEIKYEIILVDNASTETEIISYEELFPTIRVIRLNANYGFSKGNNAGMEISNGEFILLLNSDTVLKENSIKVTYDYLRNHHKAGVVSARLIFENGEHQSVAQRFPSIKYKLIELFRFQKLLSKRIRGKILLGAFFDHKENLKVDWIWGAYFMFRKNILAELKGNRLDDSFFMYAEDMQWCLDFKRLGYEVHFCAETEVIHLMGGSSGARKILMERNNELFLKKNYSIIQRLFINVLNKVLV